MVGKGLSDHNEHDSSDMALVTKRFVSDPSVLVDTALDACVALQPGLCLDSAARGEF
jgi:hypothetical protein